jgi:hypothetical protein
MQSARLAPVCSPESRTSAWKIKQARVSLQGTMLAQVDQAGVGLWPTQRGAPAGLSPVGTANVLQRLGAGVCNRTVSDCAY